MPPVRAVVFDLGHTLWDFAPAKDARSLGVLRFHALLEGALGDAVPTPRRLDRALGLALDRWMEDWNSDRLEQPPTECLVREALELAGLGAPEHLLGQLTETIFGEDIEVPVVEPDTLAAIATLHGRGLLLGCVTNTVLLESGILETLRRLGLLRYLDAVVVSSAMSYRKPHPSLFQRAIEALGVAPHEAVFVGDRLVDDVGGAKGIGMRAVLTHHYRQEPLEGASVAPDAVIRRLGELPDAIDRMEAESKEEASP
jgi:putative hydrolase of the HAD superfamily